VVGGCGTGQGYLNAVMQYPGIVCGHILNALGGNCISLALNQGYGWAADVNLRFIFDQLFSVERGGGYPQHRKEAQREARFLLDRISALAHRPFAEIIAACPDEVVGPVLAYPGMWELIDVESIADPQLKAALCRRR